MSTDSLETQAVNDYNQRHPDQETKEENNDGWDTVGKKPQRKHKQIGDNFDLMGRQNPTFCLGLSGFYDIVELKSCGGSSFLLTAEGSFGQPSMPAPIVDGSQQQEELMVEGGTISISSVYSQGLLNSLTEALQNSGVDLTQASISVQVDLGKRANRGLTPTSKEFSNGENSDQSEAQKRLKM
ncbi:hypothetical protein LXL04_033930 [Taraxacum kok-saghyz]